MFLLTGPRNLRVMFFDFVFVLLCFYQNQISVPLFYFEEAYPVIAPNLAQLDAKTQQSGVSQVEDLPGRSERRRGAPR